MQIELTLKREPGNNSGTYGVLSYKNLNVLTIEDRNRDLNHDGDLDDPGEEKIPGETRIPAGFYELKLREFGTKYLQYSKKYPFHKGMIEIRFIKGFSDVLFHIGNEPKDSRGCILIGARKQGANYILDSERAYLFFYGYILSLFDQGHQVLLRIIDSK